MRFLTDRKRAQGLGSARTGTHEHCQMIISSAALVVLVPLFIFTFGSALGGTYEEVIAYYSRPFPAVIAALTLVVGVLHMMHEVQDAIVDYVHGVAGKMAFVAAGAVAWVIIATGLFALVKLAL